MLVETYLHVSLTSIYETFRWGSGSTSSPIWSMKVPGNLETSKNCRAQHPTVVSLLADNFKPSRLFVCLFGSTALAFIPTGIK